MADEIKKHTSGEIKEICQRMSIDAGRLLQLDTPDNLKRSIGEGDVMEMKLQSTHPGSLSRAEKDLKAQGFVVNREDDRLDIRAMNLVPRIHEIYQLLEREKISIQEMKVRENTLEDVFIHLTGKSLRR